MNVPRPRGGQPGNQNARKHGYYSSAFIGVGKVNLTQAEQVNGLDDEIALLRASPFGTARRRCCQPLIGCLDIWFVSRKN